MPKLTLFNSPFPISAAVEILDANENEILDLFDRSLLKLVNSDELYGKVQDLQYWLYNFHVGVRGYAEELMRRNKGSNYYFETEYGEKFSKYYYNLISDTYYSIGKENHISALARFNIIHQGKENDFKRAIELTPDKKLSAYISVVLGKILYNLGVLSNALEYLERSIGIFEQTNDHEGLKEVYKDMGTTLLDTGRLDEALAYHTKALKIDEDLNNRVEMARDYSNIGNVLSYMGNNQQALEYLKKALEIRQDLNDRVEMARDYSNIGLALSFMGNYQEALDYHNKALEINTNLNNRIEMARDYSNIGDVFKGLNKRKEAAESVTRGLYILLEIEEQTGYHYPLIETLKQIKKSLEGVHPLFFVI